MILKIQKRAIGLIAAIAIVISALTAAEKVSEPTVRLPIIMYHHISSNAARLGKYVITKEQFKKDLEHIKAKGYKTISIKQLVDFAEKGSRLPEKPILITFDDGYESFYTYAFPILKEMKMHAVVSVIGTYSELYTQSGDDNVNYSHLTWEQIGEMAQSGFVDIGNHTYNLHTFGKRKGCRIMKGEDEQSYKAMLTADLSKLQDKIKEATKKDCNVFAYPFGSYCSQGCEIVEKLGFEVSLGCEEKLNYISANDTSKLKMMRRFNRPSGISSEVFFKNILQ